ncbi:biliverdin-producing heme oxygenase [Cohnella hashimotonis]|uniref:Biliverdin-producing heme oxygenase n=1 Tax=Cohnella hashimotonis TaxID=2826895 RepID=A0ABT6TLV0_9BACL|nr:biliverdin-producing heme oxygenase [Cohnella hashimotonis]MDI4647290.1 biliverdin-producing heme oxygenase [Cohnella hashimotonis]
MSDILTQLKERTAPQHRRAEQNKYTAAMLDHTMTLEQYAKYLALFYGYILPLERAFEARPEWNELRFDIGARTKHRLIKADLHALGWDSRAIDNLPLCQSLPDLSSFPRILGCMYVLEGSTLGGQMLTKLLMKDLPVSPDTNARYLNSYGADVRARWTEFREVLVEQARSAEDEREMLAAAGETFDRLRDWIEAPIGTVSR